MKYLFWSIIPGLILSSCAGREVRQSDLDTWQGESTAVLESHPVFSTLPREERLVPDSNGERLINFSQNKAVESGPRNCFGTGFGFGPVGLGSNVCSPRQIEYRACVHQFVIKNSRVISYRVVGQDCYTDCSFRPTQKCPEEK